MRHLTIKFFVGVFLLAAGGAGDAWAITFKDGNISKDNQVEEPAQKVEQKSSGGFLERLFRKKDRYQITVQENQNWFENRSDLTVCQSVSVNKLAKEVAELRNIDCPTILEKKRKNRLYANRSDEEVCKKLTFH